MSKKDDPYSHKLYESQPKSGGCGIVVALPALACVALAFGSGGRKKRR